MKKLFISFIAVILTTAAMAQAPQQMSYQSVIRDSDNTLVTDQTIAMQISIIQGSSSGTPVYVETHQTSTNSNGLVSIEIGNGTIVSGSFATINWAEGPHFLKTETDPSGGSNYSITGTSQLLSVPYALYADSSGNAFSGKYGDLKNRPQLWDSTYSTIKNRPDLSVYATKDMAGENITNLGDPVNEQDAATKAYIDSSSSSGWKLSGNAGIDTATDFIGTTDATPLIFRVNNAGKMRLDTNGTLAFSGMGNSLFIGNAAGANDDLSNNRNVFIGDSAGYANKSGLLNTALGYNAMHSMIYGYRNVAVGTWSLQANTRGKDNTANGYRALYLNTTGVRNTATGSWSLNDNIDGDDNTASGDHSLFHNTTGNYNTANGKGSLYYNSTGSYNTAHGGSALMRNTTGHHNTAGGYRTLYFNTTGFANVALGTHALFLNEDRSNLVAIGDSALFYNSRNASYSQHGSQNTVVGSKALYSNTTGYRNTSVGFEALHNNTEGYRNTAVGVEALFTSTTGSYNSAFGHEALLNNTTGRGNSGFGYRALRENTDAWYNTAMGYGSLYSNTTGEENTAVGTYALSRNSTGNGNTALGYNAGPYTSSYDNLSNTIALGFSADVYSSNTARIGNDNITSIGGAVGWSNLSDGRFKTGITPNVPGLDFVLKLRPVTFHWDMQALHDFRGKDNAKGRENPQMAKARQEKEQKVYTGFVAQEVEKAAEACGYDFSGVIKPANEKAVYNLTYSEFVVPIVKAIQEQNEIIEAQQKQIEELMKKIEQLQ